MRFYVQGQLQTYQYLKQGNFNVQQQYFEQQRQTSIQRNNNEKMKSCSLVRKRENFRQQIRRQYLKSYFEKKRNEMFRWGLNHHNGNIFSKHHHQQQQIDLSQIIDKNQYHKDFYNKHEQNSHFSNKNNNNSKINNYEPSYSNDYFKDVILLQRLISTKADNFLQKNTNQFHNKKCQQQHHSPDFIYSSFYSFIASIIKENLDYAYFQSRQFMFQNGSNNNHTNKKNNKIFTSHFNSLKNILYKKLYQQMQQFLVSIKQFNQSLNKKNTWGYHNILLQTYVKLIYQLTQFIKSQNLSQTNCVCKQYRDSIDLNSNSIINGQYPIIPIHEQLQYLVNMLISITYFDQVQQQQQGKQEQTFFQTQNKLYSNKQQQQNKIYHHQQVINTYLNNQQQHYQNNYNNQQSNKSQYLNVQMTRILVQKTQILDTLKFIIVFGLMGWNDNNNMEFNNYGHLQHNNNTNLNNNNITQKKRRQHMISLMIVLLRNISINIGSDILFENGIIAELKCILKQPLFHVQIRRKNKMNNKKDKYNHKQQKQQQQQQRNNQYNKPTLHYRIQSFLMDSCQMIRHQSSQQYLSQMDSFQFTFDVLQHLYHDIAKVKQQCRDNYVNSDGDQVDACYDDQNDDDFIVYDNNNNNNDIDNYDHINTQQQIKQTIKGYKLQKLNKLAQKSIQCLRFHLYLGEIYLLTKTNSNNSNLFTQKQYQNNPYYFSTKNRYVVKFNYIPNSQQILMNFQTGRQLLNIIPRY